MRETKVKLDEREIVVRKIPIGEYPELIKAIKKLPKYLQNWDSLEVEKIIEILPTIIGESLPDFLMIVSLMVKVPYNEISSLGLDEIAKLVRAIFEVNNYAEVYQIIKKAFAHPALKNLSQKPPKTP